MTDRRTIGTIVRLKDIRLSIIKSEIAGMKENRRLVAENLNAFNNEREVLIEAIQHRINNLINIQDTQVLSGSDIARSYQKAVTQKTRLTLVNGNIKQHKSTIEEINVNIAERIQNLLKLSNKIKAWENYISIHMAHKMYNFDY